MASSSAGEGFDSASPAFERAVAALKAGRAIIFPTDTVYGLGVAVNYAASPREIYELKRREAGKPIAWLVGSVEELQRLGSGVSREACELARRRWPGPLTIVVKASDEVPSSYAPGGTIGLRMPASDAALALVLAVGPIAASSANRAGMTPPSAFSQIDEALCAEVACVYACGGTSGGVSSTVVDATGADVRVIRQGPVALAP